MSRPATLAALVALLATSLPGAAQHDEAGALLAPRLVHYSMKCHSDRTCRIECFQGGVSVASRLNIGRGDAVRLVVNAGISDQIVPRWIEIRPASGDDIQTILLTDQTLCDFQALTIEPIEAK